MEQLNVSLKNVIQFILCIQDACDNHRKCMEHLWQQEYTSYVNEWKPSHTESKLPNVKNTEVKSHNASKCVQVDSEDKLKTEADLDLILADSLLEKARNIRTKNKKLVNGLVDSKILSTFPIDKVVTSSANCDLKQVPEKIKSRIKLPQSKSDIMINSRKSYIVPRSKSASIPFIPKTSKIICDSKSCSALSPKTSVVTHTNSTSNKMSKSFAVISSNDLDQLKNLQLNLPSSHNSKARKATLSSDASEIRNRIFSHPSSIEFSSLMKDRLNDISCEVKLKTWYPFLSSKSDAFLTTVRCSSFSSIKKVYSILCNIQEIMIWIDLLHLLETEICPNLIVDVTDVNSLRVFSYLRSIHHPNLQRIPIVFPIKQK